MIESKNLELARNCVRTSYQILLDFPGIKSKILLIFQIQDMSIVHVLYIAKLPMPLNFDQVYDHLLQCKEKYPRLPSLLICSPEKVLMEASLAVFRDCQIQICLDSLLQFLKKAINAELNQELEKDIAEVLHQNDLNRFIQSYIATREKWKSSHPCLMDEMDAFMPFLIPMYQYKNEVRPYISSIEYAQPQLYFIHHFLNDWLETQSWNDFESIPLQINSYLQSLPLELNT